MAVNAGIRATLALAVVCGTLPAAHASIVRSMSLRELAAEADDIVVAKVVSVTAAWDKSHRRIVSTVEADVDEVWKGNTSAGRMTIVQLGGTVGDIEMTVYGMPSFSIAERALLFLRRGAQHRVVVGMSEGKRSLRWDSAAKQWFVQGRDIENILEMASDGTVQLPVAAPAVGLDVMRARIRAMAGEK